jgi:hypothetical protein
MALYSSPVLRKKQPLQPMQRDQMPALDPTGGTAPKPMAFSGQPQSLGGTMPRAPGSVVPKPPASRVGVMPAAPGFNGPRQPSPPQQPRPNPLPSPAPAPAPPPAQGMTETPSEPAPTTTDDVDQMIRDFITGQLRGAGQANTAEEEALIQQQIERSMGQGLVNQRARAGRAGMGMSGALMAQEGDIRRAASMDALDQILGLRRSEEQRGIENAMGAISAETGMRSAAANDALRRMALEALQAEMGLDAGPSTTEDRQRQWEQDAIARGADTNGDGVLSESEKQADTTSRMAGHQAWSDFNNSGGDKASLPVMPGPGNGWEVVFPPGSDRDGNPKPGQLFNPSTGAIAIYY